MSGQRTQKSPLPFQTAADGLVLPGHRPLLIGQAVLAHLLVDRFQHVTHRQWHEIVAPGVAHQILDTTFLPACTHVGEECFEAIDTLQVQKGFLFPSAVPTEHLLHRRFEVVIDRQAR
ncbi:MAG: hypothetical protein ACXWPS_15100, partial [Ktedonobacteraceae bacterium]